VIVDEEHDVSYKQGETPRYHARDVAVYRGFKAKATVLLGSATPSLESSYNVQLGKYHPLYLKKRIFQPTLPEVRLINLKHCDRQKGSPFFSIELLDAIRQRLLKKEQTLIFLNRRGFAPLMICGECNETHTCPNCSLSLVFHQAVGGLKCHHCDYFLITPQKCPACDSSESPKIVGSGTEQIETELKNIYPNAEVLRMDRDSLHGKHALSKMQRRIHDQEVDIVVGTQLITKGHDFPNVTLVGVILADLSLNLPDFRSGERTFQLLTQVAGRAGRAEKPGEVLIQTYNPKHHSLQCAKDHDTLRYLEIELKQRNLLKIPPFLSMVLILCSSPSEKRAETLAFSVRNRFKKLPPSLTVIGPVESPLKKLRNRYRWQVLIKAPDASMLKCQLNRLMKEPLKLQKDELLQIDIDPHHLI
jgi:primosomal protein N' (replication factor Y)